MKNIFPVVFLLILAVFAADCESDDICDPNTPTTPRLIIDFYDINSGNTLKKVVELKIHSTDPLSDTLVYTGVSKIMVPLKTDADKTTFIFDLRTSSTSADIQTDILEFNYARHDVYVSRACGYKTLFDLNTDPLLPKAVILNDDPASYTGNWMQNVAIENYNLLSENETHIRIYF